MLREKIGQYSEQFLDGKYIENLVQKHTMEDILTEISNILKSKKTEEIHSTLMLIRDLCIAGSTNILRDYTYKFRNLVLETEIFLIMNNLLYNCDILLIKDVIYTFGKLNFPQNIIYLEKAYDYYDNNDQDVSSYILNELEWLKND